MSFFESMKLDILEIQILLVGTRKSPKSPQTLMIVLISEFRGRLPLNCLLSGTAIKIAQEHTREKDLDPPSQLGRILPWERSQTKNGPQTKEWIKTSLQM